MKLDNATILRLASGSFRERRTLFVPMRKLVQDGRRWGVLEGVCLGITLCLLVGSVIGMIGVLAGDLESWAWFCAPLGCGLFSVGVTGACSMQVESYLYRKAEAWDEPELGTQNASVDESVLDNETVG